MNNKINIVAASYGKQISRLQQIQNAIPENVNMIILDKALDDLIDIAKHLELEQNVDVFIASGGNAALLSKYVKTPIVRMVATGTDMLIAISDALEVCENICVVTYAEVKPSTSIIRKFSGKNIREVTYTSQAELEEKIFREYEQGVTGIVGGSLSLKIGEKYGMKGYSIPTNHGISEAISAAIDMAIAKRNEKDLSRRLGSILSFTREGIIATDREGNIVEFNPSAENIMGISREYVIGKKAGLVIPNTRLDVVANSNIKELDAIQDLGDIRILTNRVPIISDGEVIGALATFQNVSVVQSSEEKLRKRLTSKGLVAKSKLQDIIGESPAIRRAKLMAERYALTNSTVLITGESGTGKELFAQSIHNASGRAKKPFVAINCAALSHSLLESELFGYEGGSFTGAKKEGKQGLFELADTGTIFLDEIGDIDLDLQAKLLRVLEQREVMRVGGEVLHPIDVRVIAATNKDLWKMTQEKTFRSDLYYRLNILELNVPTLRERETDIPLLMRFFLKRYCPELDDDTVSDILRDPKLKEYHWPGNIRELRSVVERFSSLYGAPGKWLVSEFITRHDEEERETEFKGEHAECSISEINQAIERCGGNKTKAAKMLKISRSTLWRRLSEAKKNSK